MKTFLCAGAIGLLYLTVSVLPVQSQTQMLEGYTFVGTSRGTAICLGRWVPSRDVALPGTCEGQLLDTSLLTALSARMSADRLEQILIFLAAIDQKMADNNDQVRQLTEATVKTQESIDEQVLRINEFLSDTIARRFDALPREMLDNDLFREELAKLRKDILKEVEKQYSKRPTPQRK